MLAFPAGFKIYLAVEPVDMRKQFNGRWALAGEKLQEDPRSGAVFVFCNKDRDRVKLLYWDGTGVRQAEYLRPHPSPCSTDSHHKPGA